MVATLAIVFTLRREQYDLNILRLDLLVGKGGVTRIIIHRKTTAERM
jgi:hypothetical protein